MYGKAMVNIPKDFQDFDNDDPNLEKRLSRFKYWANLKNLKLEFYNETQSRDHTQYMIWLENKYGFRPIETNEGMMTDDYKVVDEKKFIVYIIKYGK
jgi:hypothetical protein